MGFFPFQLQQGAQEAVSSGIHIRLIRPSITP